MPHSEFAIFGNLVSGPDNLFRFVRLSYVGPAVKYSSLSVRSSTQFVAHGSLHEPVFVGMLLHSTVRTFYKSVINLPYDYSQVSAMCARLFA